MLNTIISIPIVSGMLNYFNLLSPCSVENSLSFQRPKISQACNMCNREQFIKNIKG